MKVVHINENDTYGGAAKASYRIHLEFLKNNINSKYITPNKFSSNISVNSTSNPFEAFFLSFIRKFNKLFLFFYRNRKKQKFSVNLFTFFPWFSIKKKLDKANIIILYWVEDSILNFSSISKFNKPIFWRLSDLAPMTGGCHYSGGCDKFTNLCNKCHVLSSSNKYDLSYYQFKQKLKKIEELDLTIIAPSNWIAEKARASKVFKNTNIVVINTGVNLDIFYRKSSDCKSFFDLDKNKTVLLFGSVKSLNDPRKGILLLIKALDYLPNKHEFELVIFGDSNEVTNSFKYSTKSIGVISDEKVLSKAYNAADIFLCPSIEDNLPNTILESMACGTPVVAFDIGGNSDPITHKKNGYLSKPNDYIDFAKGISWIHNYLKDSNDLNYKCLNKIQSDFDIEKQSKKIIDLVSLKNEAEINKIK